MICKTHIPIKLNLVKSGNSVGELVHYLIIVAIFGMRTGPTLVSMKFNSHNFPT